MTGPDRLDINHMTRPSDASHHLNSVTACFVTHNSVASLANAINQISGVRAIVVDSGSSDHRYLLQTTADEIWSTDNYGYGTCLNIAANRADTKWLLFMNPDVEIDPTAIALMIDRAEAANLAICGPALDDSADYGHFNDLPTPPWRRQNRPRLDAPQLGLHRVLSLQGSCMLVRRHAFERLGGFNEQYFLYFEEIDLCWRASAAGYEIAVIADARAIHIGQSSSADVSATW